MYVTMEKISGSNQYAATDENGNITVLSFWQHQKELDNGFWIYRDGKDVRQIKTSKTITPIKKTKEVFLDSLNDSLFG